MRDKLPIFYKKKRSDQEMQTIERYEPKTEEGQNQQGEVAASQSKSDSLFQIPNELKNQKEMMDLISAVEKMIHYHQVTKHQHDELKNRLHHRTSQFSEEQKEKNRLTSVVEEKNRMIESLENSISEKNLKFDQLMEEYNDLKFQLSNQIDELKNRIDVEQKKYKSFNEQHEEEIMDWVNKVKKKDEQILKLQSENSHLKEQNEQIRKDNKYLLKTVNDFTSRMSVSFANYGGEEEQNEK